MTLTPRASAAGRPAFRRDRDVAVGPVYHMRHLVAVHVVCGREKRSATVALSVKGAVRRMRTRCTTKDTSLSPGKHTNT